MAPVTTPFDAATGEIALERAVDNGRRLLAEGLAGLVVAGSTGEAALLEPDEQRRLVAALRPVVPADRWLVVGTGAESTRAAVALSRTAGAEGADAVLVRPPSYYGTAYSQESLVAHFRAIADASPVPVLVYNIPKYTHISISPELLALLTDHGNIAGAKDSSGDLKNLASYRAAAPAWTVLVGSGSLLLPAMEAGCEGGIVGVACFAAGLAMEVLTVFRQGDRARAIALQSRLASLDKEIVGRLGPAGIKAAMDGVGLYGGPPRDPLSPLTPSDRERIVRLVAA